MKMHFHTCSNWDLKPLMFGKEWLTRHNLEEGYTFSKPHISLNKIGGLRWRPAFAESILYEQ